VDSSNYYRWSRGSDGFPGTGRHAFQWQPTTTAHDPNPPITLEDGAPPVSSDDIIAYFVLLDNQQVIEVEQQEFWITQLFESVAVVDDVVSVFALLDYQVSVDDESVDTWIGQVFDVDAAVADFITSALDEQSLQEQADVDGWWIGINVADFELEFIVLQSVTSDLQDEGYEFSDFGGSASGYDPTFDPDIIDYIVRARRRGRR